MDQKLKNDTLFLMPCCKAKESGGIVLDKYDDMLKRYVSPAVYNKIISVRRALLSNIKQKKDDNSEETSKNRKIKYGPDFGSTNLSGTYLPAIDRYIGYLYKAEKNFAEIIKKGMFKPDKPRIIILSALYGPLHPLSMIQYYDLKMSDSKKIWKAHFPIFLKNYVELNKIKNIHLYFGRSTCYFDVVAKAVRPLLEKGIINQAIQFEIEEGSSRVTPENHGRLLLAHFQSKNDPALTRRIRSNYL